MGRRCERHFSKVDIQMNSRHMKRCWASLIAAVVAAKSLQSCPTLCNPVDGSPPGSPVPGILQARSLEWVAISFSNAGKWKVKVKSLSHVRTFMTAWTAADQAPLAMGFSRQEYWSGVPLPSPKVKQESEKAGLALDILKTKIMASSPCLHGKQKQKSGSSDRVSFLGLQNHFRWLLQPWN